MIRFFSVFILVSLSAILYSEDFYLKDIDYLGKSLDEIKAFESLDKNKALISEYEDDLFYAMIINNERIKIEYRKNNEKFYCDQILYNVSDKLFYNIKSNFVKNYSKPIVFSESVMYTNINYNNKNFAIGFIGKEGTIKIIGVTEMIMYNQAMKISN